MTVADEGRGPLPLPTPLLDAFRRPLGIPMHLGPGLSHGPYTDATESGMCL